MRLEQRMMKTRRALGRAAMIMVLMLTMAAGVKAQSHRTVAALPQDLAEELGEVLVYYNGRIAPLETMARDYIKKVYGKPSVGGIGAMQAFSGWMFYDDTWTEVPVKKRGTQTEAELRALITEVADQKALRLIPSEGNWYSPGDMVAAVYEERTGHTSFLSSIEDQEVLDQLLNFQEAWTQCGMRVLAGDFQGASKELDAIKTTQKEILGDSCPSESRLRMEHLYNKCARPATFTLILAALALVLFFAVRRIFASKR